MVLKRKLSSPVAMVRLEPKSSVNFAPKNLSFLILVGCFLFFCTILLIIFWIYSQLTNPRVVGFNEDYAAKYRYQANSSLFLGREVDSIDHSAGDYIFTQKTFLKNVLVYKKFTLELSMSCSGGNLQTRFTVKPRCGYSAFPQRGFLFPACEEKPICLLS